MTLHILTGKKAIFFTSIAILITALLIITYGSPTNTIFKDQLIATQAKADAANSMVRELRNSYLPESLYVSAYSAFAAMSEYMRQSGDYFPAAPPNSAQWVFNQTLKEIIINGTMCCNINPPPNCRLDRRADVDDPSIHKGVDDCLGKTIMQDRNFTKKLSDFENASFNAFRIRTRFSRDYGNMYLWYYQDNNTGPWRIGVNLTVNYSVAAGDVMINNTENISVVFNIEGIQDPLYAVESPKLPQDGSILYTNAFNDTNLTNWNISTFYHQLDWRLYAHDENASSFLMRFYGNDERSPCCGVESLINPFVMSTVDGNIEKSYVDWCYYGQANRCTSATTGALWNVTCVTTDADGTKFFRFAIDTYHTVKYNISDSKYLYNLGPPPPCPETPFPAP